jgi:hypothetical protein
MKRSVSTNRAIVTSGLFLAICCLGGCEENKVGPKREDHKAAHSARYNPGVARPQTAAASQPATTQPMAFELPTEMPEAASGTPVLFVNNKPLTVQEVLEEILPELQQLAGSAASEREYYRNASRIIADQIRHQASLIVIYEQAKLKLPDKTDETLDKEADKVIQRVLNARFAGAKARYESHLKTLGLTMKDIRERTKRQLLVSNYLHQRFDPMISDPPRRDLLGYYQAHLKDFTTQAKAELLMIEIPLQEEIGKPVAQANEQQVAEARRQARDELRRARDEIDSGVEFTAVARRYSKGAQRASGGSWGEITPGSLSGSWAKAADILFALKEGQISGIIETEESSFIVKCGRSSPEKRLTFEEAQTRIVERVRDMEYERLTSRYIADLIQKAAIDEKQQQAFFFAAVSAAPRPNPKQPAPETGSVFGN